MAWADSPLKEGEAYVVQGEDAEVDADGDVVARGAGAHSCSGWGFGVTTAEGGRVS